MTRLREVVIRAERIGGHSKKPRTFSPGRTCTVCPTILSIFNKGDRCSVHASPVFRKYRARNKESAA